MVILAIDQGTTGTTCIIYNEKGVALARAYRELTQIYPEPGCVEHDPNEIGQTVVKCIGELQQLTPCPINAELLGIPILRPQNIESTSLGAANLGRITQQLNKPLHHPTRRLKIRFRKDLHGKNTADQWLKGKFTHKQLKRLRFQIAQRVVIFPVNSAMNMQHLCFGQIAFEIVGRRESVVFEVANIKCHGEAELLDDRPDKLKGVVEIFGTER